MSSLRNAVKRITHKERAQPQSRSHLGFLEKKTDYKVRATDYHRKEDRLNAMKQKAAMRNPDEFYFGMNNAEVRDGHHRKTVAAKQKEFEAAVGHDTVRIMKDQDLSYVRMQKQSDRKKAEKLKASLHLLPQSSLSSKKKHVVFVDSREEANEFDAAKHFDTLPELTGRTFNRPRFKKVKQAAASEAHDGDERRLTTDDIQAGEKTQRKQARKLARARASAYGELEARELRVKAMERAEAHIVTEKLVASKGRKRKIKAAENGMPAQYKWRRKRLR